MSHQETTDIQGLTNRLTAMTREDIHNAAAGRPARAPQLQTTSPGGTPPRASSVYCETSADAAPLPSQPTTRRAVQHAAHNAGVALDDPEVARAARAAGDVACAITAGRAARADLASFLARLGPELVDRPTFAP